MISKVNQNQTEPQQPAVLDQHKLQMLTQKYQNEQNLSMGILAGFGAAFAGAVIWALVSFFTGYQIGWMAIGVGFVVGFAIKTVGKGIDISFGIAGAVISLIGCALGNLLTICISIAAYQEVSFFDVFWSLDLAAIGTLFQETFSPMDILFYALAVYYGYRYSIAHFTEEEIQGLVKG